MEPQNTAYSSLEGYSYRNLQQIAKSCGLPSNVKKMILIEMIIAKKHSTDEQLHAIVSRVKEERLKLQSHNKKIKKKGKRMQGYELISTSQKHSTLPHSPPKSGSPKRSLYHQYTPDVTTSKLQPKKSSQKVITPKSNDSDRILRSFNMKKNNYSVSECKDTPIKIVQAQKPMQVSQGVRALPVNVCIQKSVPRKVLNASLKKLLPEQNKNAQQPPMQIQRTISGIHTLKNKYYKYVPAVGFRRSDGKMCKINAIIEKPRKPQQYHPIQVTMQDVINRKVDNTIRDIPKSPSIDYRQANVRDYGALAFDYEPQDIDNQESSTMTYNNSPSLFKPQNTSNCYESNTFNNFEGGTLRTYGTRASQSREINASNGGTNTFNAIGNSAINDGTNTEDIFSHGNNLLAAENSQAKPNTIESSILNTNTYTNVPINSDNGTYAVYCHKKMRSEQVTRVTVPENPLPSIKSTFSLFNEVQHRSLTEPLFVDINQDSSGTLPQNFLFGNEKTSMLETLYNFKLEFVINQPLLTIATTSNTRCVFSTTTAPTAVAHSAPAFNEYNNNITFDRISPFNCNLEGDTRLNDYMRMPDQDFEQVLSQASSRITSNSQELETNVTFPEMVEDALEIINQDGDYMERLDLEVKMQCILCDWAGSKIILEYHIRQSHQKEILYKNGPFTIELSLGALVSHGMWLSHIVHYKDNMYAVSSYYNKNRISVILTKLSETATPKKGQIIMYNKITGKPFEWEAEIPLIPATLPFTSTFNGLEVDITSLDLLPNSANLKLVDNELKLVSNNKVVIGPTSLNDIDIVLHVAVFE